MARNPVTSSRRPAPPGGHLLAKSGALARLTAALDDAGSGATWRRGEIAATRCDGQIPTNG